MTGSSGPVARPCRLGPEAAPVLAESATLARAFAAAGYRLFLVGGIVRDLVMGASVAVGDVDLDYTTDATPVEIKRIVGPIADSVWAQGERFGTIAATVRGRQVEITTHRAEAYDPASRKPDVVFSTDIEVDLSRRDFTINALAVEVTDLRTGDAVVEAAEVIDPFGGLDDLRRLVLRTPRSPAESFSDDPLRMLRAARFVARLGVVADRDLVTAVVDMAPRLDVVSAERVRDELMKTLGAGAPGAGLRLLLETGLADRFLPELSTALDRFPTLLDRLGEAPPDPELRLAAVLVVVGERGAASRTRRLRTSTATTRRVSAAVAVAVAVLGHVGPWSDAEVRRLAHAASDHLDDGVVVARVLGATGDEFSTRRDSLADDLAGLSPTASPLDGAAVMAHLGLEPGPAVGRAVRALADLRLERGPMSPAEAYAALDRWAAEQSDAT